MTTRLLLVLLFCATSAAADALPPGKMLIFGVEDSPRMVDISTAAPIRGGIRYRELDATTSSFTTLPALANIGQDSTTAGVRGLCQGEVTVQCFDPSTGGTVYYGPVCELRVRIGALTWIETSFDGPRYIATLPCLVTGIVGGLADR